MLDVEDFDDTLISRCSFGRIRILMEMVRFKLNRDESSLSGHSMRHISLKESSKIQLRVHKNNKIISQSLTCFKNIRNTKNCRIKQLG